MCWLCLLLRSESLSLIPRQNKRKNKQKLVSNAATHVRLHFSHILASRNFICSKYSRRIKVDILLPIIFSLLEIVTFLHIFVSKQLRTKPERYTFFLIDDKCESLDFNASSLLLVQGSISRMYFVVDVSVVKFHHGYLKP